ncbi:unnamed protein product [Schistosoma margrebowiei]|uniref:Uncharacterized protein n=1 Tax=Schistosoma margrebowiei TaxID=48269 RepID=A0AA84Z665_9TREM|nr:unnamed protein product [Schistosoma margrebowiei]
MDLPAVFKSTLDLPVAGFTVTIVQIEFSDHLMVLISRNGMIGDIVLSQKSNLPTVNGHVSHDLDTRTLFGPDKFCLQIYDLFPCNASIVL